MRILTLLRHGYGIAFALTLLVFGVSLWVGPWGERTAFALYLGAPIVGAYFGGMKTGFWTTVLAAVGLVVQYFLLPPDSSPRHGFDLVPSLLLLLLVGSVASYLSEECLGALQSAGRLQHALGRLREAVVLVDDQGQVWLLNDAARALTGWDYLDARGQPAEKVLPLIEEDSRRPVVGFLARHSGGSPAGPRTALLVSRNSSEIPIEYRTEVLPDTRGGSAGLLIALRDLRDQRRREQEGKQREGQLRALVEQRERELTEQKQAEEGLRRSHQEREKKAEKRIAALTKTQSTLEEQLAQRQRDEEQRRQEQLQQQAGWQRTEDQLRQQLAELTQTNHHAQQQLAERMRAEEELRRAQAQSQTERQRVEEKHRQEIGELAQTRQLAQEQLAERQRAEDHLRRELARQQEDGRRAEEQLRRETAEQTQARQLAEQQLAESRQREQDLRRQLEDLQAERQLLEEELRRQQEASERAADDWRGQLAAEHRRAEEEQARWQQERTAQEETLEQLRQQERDLRAAARNAEAVLERHAERCRPALERLREAIQALREGSPQSVDALEQQVRYLSWLADGWCTAGRLARNDLHLKRQPVELSAALDQAVATVAPVLGARRQHLTVSLPLGPEWLWMDPAQLDQVLAALLDHAAERTETGGRLQLSAEQANGILSLRVMESGLGLSEPEEDSTGLGMTWSLARRLVELHGGKVSVAPGEYVLHLPALPESAPNAGEVSAPGLR